jgi:hypothetical protein
MFLLLAAEHLSVNLPKNVNFEGYFEQIKQSAGIELPARPAMRRMNNSRVNLKHHGIIPSAIYLTQSQADVTTFLTDATQMVFTADFASLDMIDLVTRQSALALLRNAEIKAGQADHTEALALLSEAFEDLLSDYAHRKQGTGEFSPYTLWPAGPHVGRTMQGHHDPELTKRLEQTEDALDRIQRSFRVLAIGVDYRRYARFELLVPQVLQFMDGHREVRPVPGLSVGDDEYQFCKQFVIETALHLAELDFDLDLYDLFVEYHRLQHTAANEPGSSGT